MNTKERLTRNRIQIMRKNSFFAYLSLYLKFQESKELPDYAGAGVDEQGNFYYKEDYFKKLSDEEIQGIIIHELLHLSLLHLLRGREKDRLKFNIACDVVVNQLIKDNGFKLPKGCLMPDNQNKIKIGNQTISNTDKKIAEEVYNELKDLFKKQKGQGKGKGNKDGDEDDDGEYSFKEGEGRFDEHIQGKGKPLSEEEKRKLEKEWLDRTQQALAVSKMKGDLPIGIERLVGKLHESKVNWRTLLLRYIQSYIPKDFNYSYPSKKSISSGVYMPSTTKECIEIAVGIDVSGSIGQEELNEFLSEIIGIARTFRGRIKMHLFSHETEVNDKYIVENGDVKKILELKIHGGGGTSHIQPMEYVNENIRGCKLVVWLTDGFSDLNTINFKKNKFDSIFIISKNGTEEQLKEKGVKVIKLKN